MEEKRPLEDILNEIKTKLAFYNGSYQFSCDDDCIAKINDGNKFDVYGIGINDNTGGVLLRLFSDITEDFDAVADYRIENLQEICDCIPAPKELLIQVFINTGYDEYWADVFSKMFKPDLSATQVLKIIQTQFPAIDWSEDGPNKWEGVPHTINDEFKRCYFIAAYGDK